MSSGIICVEIETSILASSFHLQLRAIYETHCSLVMADLSYLDFCSFHGGPVTWITSKLTQLRKFSQNGQTYELQNQKNVHTD